MIYLSTSSFVTVVPVPTAVADASPPLTVVSTGVVSDGLSDGVSGVV